MSEISNSVSLLYSLQDHYNLVNTFARNAYNEKFKDIKISLNSFHYYLGYDIIGPDEIRVKYVYGAGEMEYHDSFNVKI